MPEGILARDVVWGILAVDMAGNIVRGGGLCPNAGMAATIDLTRFAIQAKGPAGNWTRKPLAYRESNNVHLLITRPPEICVNFVFKYIHAASSYTICRQFVPFIYCHL